MNPPPLFIVGPRRSGTTLLCRILTSHSRLAVYFETQYYPLLRPDLHRYGNLRRRPNLLRLVHDVIEIARAQGCMRPPTPDELLDALPAPTFEGVLAAWLHLYAAQQGKPRGGDKTPDHYSFLPEILERFPASPVIFSVRDPRDTAISNRDAFGTSPEATAWAWRHAADVFRSATRPVHLVRYEELVERPETAVGAACEFLGERFEPGMLRFFEQRSTVPGFHHAKVRRPVDAESVGRSRALPAADVAMIEAICAEGMEALGYPRTLSMPPRRVSPPGRLSFIANRLRYYAKEPARLRRGWVRWKIVLRLRARYLLSLGWASR